jgi:tetratricopeptide (TPR) repeat protein
VKVPSTVQAVLASRIDRLAPTEKGLLQTLAVLGMEFSLTLVQRVTAKSGDELEEILAQLHFGEFIYEQPAVGGVEYVFKHALTQEVAYNALLMERRKVLHEQAGQALEALFADRLDDCAADLARHYERSGNARKAVEYLVRAGQRATQQAARPEVVEYVTRALELINRIPDGTDQAYYELESQINLSVSLAAAAPASAEREQALMRALELCEHLGDSRMMEVMLDLGFLQGARGEPAAALQLFEKTLALGEQAKDADVIAPAHGGMGIQLITLGLLENAREHFEDTIELCSSHPIRAVGQTSRIIQLRASLLGLTLLLLGYPTTALKTSTIALHGVRGRSGPIINALALVVYILTYLASGDLQAVAAQIEELVAITAQHEMPVVHAFATFYRAGLRADASRVNEALAEMRGSIKQAGVFPMARMLVAALAEVCRSHGLLDEGLAIINEALAKSDKTPWLHAEFHRLKGELIFLKDPRSKEEAESCLRKAIDIAQHQSARLFELRATPSLARLLAKQNRRDEARTMLAEIYNWFTEGFDTADLKEAKSLLDELSGLMEYTKLTGKQGEWWVECAWLDGSTQELPTAHFEMVDPLTGEFRRGENSIRPIREMLRFPDKVEKWLWLLKQTRPVAVTGPILYDGEGRPFAHYKPDSFSVPPGFSFKEYFAVFDIDDLKIEEDDNHNLTLIRFTLIHRHKKHKQ